MKVIDLLNEEFHDDPVDLSTKESIMEEIGFQLEKLKSLVNNLVIKITPSYLDHKAMDAINHSNYIININNINIININNINIINHINYIINMITDNDNDKRLKAHLLEYVNKTKIKINAICNKIKELIELYKAK